MDWQKTIPMAVWGRYVDGLASVGLAGWALVCVVFVALAASLLRWPTGESRLRRPVKVAAWLLPAAGALAWAWHQRWISDDAFISFRYARNLALGHGLVFNPGERVEGYTNFLWTLLLAGASKLHLAPGLTSLVLGLLSLAACLALVRDLADRLSPRRAPVILSIGVVLLATHTFIADYGTSGLETVFAATLVLLSLHRALAARPLQAGLASVAAIMAHPDHAIFYGALAAALWLQNRSRRDLLRYLAPMLLVYTPYFLWRWHYYGSFFPNTFYAKSASEAYLSQGYVYVVVCVIGGGLMGWLPLALLGLYTKRNHLLGRFIMLALPPYLFYVMKIGGDFMMGRLLIPLMPPLALLVELGARNLSAARQRACAYAGIALAMASVLPIRVIRPSEKLFHIADERSFYPVHSVTPMRVDSPFTNWSDSLIRAFGRGPDGPTTAIGCIGIVAYRTGYPMLDVFGLTDPNVARQPIAVRGRPGHEKRAAPGYLLDRGVLITDQPVYPPEYARLTEVIPGRIPLYLAAYDPHVVTALRAQDHNAFADMEQLLEHYAPPVALPDRFACDLWFFETYYFAHQDPTRRDAFVDKMRAAGHLSALDAELRRLPHGSTPSGWIRAGGIDFEQIDQRDWLVHGTAFDGWPSLQDSAGQGTVARRVGAFLNSFSVVEGDRAIGQLQSPSFTIEGDIITLLVAGGRDPDRLRVDLLIDGYVIASATGCGSEILGRRVWDVTEHVGRQARLVIRDGSPDGWGHIVLDEVTQWRRAR